MTARDLAGHEAPIKGAFQVVAHGFRRGEDVARASGPVAAGGRESGNGSSAGVAARERLKKPEKIAPQALRSGFDFGTLDGRCQWNGATAEEL
jgi:hypothetical protein